MSGDEHSRTLTKGDIQRILRMKSIGQTIGRNFKTQQLAIRYLAPYISSSTVKRLVESCGLEIEAFQSRDKTIISEQNLNTVELILGVRRDGDILYRNIILAINQDRGMLATIADRFVGSYRYFRYRMRSSNEIEYVSGRITIVDQRQSIVFHHYRDDDFTKIRHEGHVFFADKKLIMLGYAEGYLRLSITNMDVLNHTTDLLHGALTSVSSSSRLPFSSHYLLVHESNEREIEKLWSQSPAVKDPNGPADRRLFEKTLGEQYFVQNMPELVFLIRGHKKQGRTVK